MLAQYLDAEGAATFFYQTLRERATVTQPALEGGRGNPVLELGVRLPLHGAGF